MRSLTGASDSYVPDRDDRDVKLLLLEYVGIKHLVAQIYTGSIYP